MTEEIEVKKFISSKEDATESMHSVEKKAHQTALETLPEKTEVETPQTIPEPSQEKGAHTPKEKVEMEE